MYLLDVDGVNQKISDIQSLRGDDFEAEVNLIQENCRAYVAANFEASPEQQEAMAKHTPEDWKGYGEWLATAFRKGQTVVAEPTEGKAKCPKIKITIEITF